MKTRSAGGRTEGPVPAQGIPSTNRDATGLDDVNQGRVPLPGATLSSPRQTGAGEGKETTMSLMFPLLRRAALASGALALMAGAAFAAGTPGTADPVMGQQLFRSHCAVCHKADASGGVKLGDATSADLQAPELESQYKETDALILRAMLDGKDEDGEDLAKVMPRWRGKITDAQAADILAYLKTVTAH